MMVSHFWTEDRVDTLKTLFDKGLSFAQIARRLGGGCTRNAALGKAQRMGFTRYMPPRLVVWTKERVDTVVQMVLDECSNAEIAAAVQVSKSSVAAKIQSLRIQGRLPPATRAPRSIREARPRPNNLAAHNIQKKTRLHPAGNCVYVVSEDRPLPPETFEVPVDAKPVPLLQLTFGMCKWPIGDPMNPDFGFCGCATETTYCPTHAAIAYQPAPVRKATVNDLMRSIRRHL